MGLDTGIDLELKKGRNGIVGSEEVCYWRKEYTITSRIFKELNYKFDEYDECCSCFCILDNEDLEKVIKLLEKLYEPEFWFSKENRSIWKNYPEQLEHYKEQLEKLKTYRGMLTDDFDYELRYFACG